MAEDTKTQPQHYTSIPNGMQSIDIIEVHNLGFHLGNCVKYILRAGKKINESEVDDLKKARWYLNRQLKNLGVVEKEESSEILNAIHIAANKAAGGKIAISEIPDLIRNLSNESSKS